MPHKGPRFIPNTGNLSKCANPQENLEEYLSAIVTGYPPIQPPDKLSGLFYGYSSVAYLFLVLSRIYTGPRALQIEGKSCKQWSEMYAYVGNNQPTDADRGRWGVGDNGLVTWRQSPLRPFFKAFSRGGSGRHEDAGRSVDPRQPADRAHVDPVVFDREVAPFDERHPHLAREKDMFKIGRVVGAGR